MGAIMTDEDKAKMSIAMTSLLEATKAKNNLSRALVAFAHHAKDGTPLDVNTVLAQIDEAMAELAKAIDEAKVFRNFVRDDRSAAIKGRARVYSRDPWRHRDVYGGDFPRHHRDPKDVIASTLGRKPS